MPVYGGVDAPVATMVAGTMPIYGTPEVVSSHAIDILVKEKEEDEDVRRQRVRLGPFKSARPSTDCLFAVL